MKIYIFLFCAFLVMVFSLPENAAAKHYDPDKIYSVQELREDLAFLKNKLERKNPLLYLYCSKSKLDSVFDSLSKNITPMNFTHFYELLVPLQSVIKDGHTRVEFGAAPAKSYFAKDSTLIPLNIISTENKLYSIMCLGPDTTIADGSEIVSIDGLASQTIIARLLKCVMHDGNNLSGSMLNINRSFLGLYSMYIGRPDHFEISYRGKDSLLKTYTLKAQPMDTTDFYFKLRYAKKFENKNLKKGIRLAIMKEQSTAVLTIPSFSRKFCRKFFHQDFHYQIAKDFRLIREAKIQHLIIDLRNNGGGNDDPAKFLLRHLFTSQFEFREKIYFVKKRKRFDMQRRNYSLKFRDAVMGNSHPVLDPFKGDVYVLINGGTFSASCLVCSSLHYYHRATFIGEETGGQEYLCGGYASKTYVITLPNTKMKLNSSNFLTIVKVDAPNTGRGIMPDYPIKPSIADYMERKEIVLPFALNLIAEKNKK